MRLTHAIPGNRMIQAPNDHDSLKEHRKVAVPFF
jgi:hypothetical protein